MSRTAAGRPDFRLRLKYPAISVECSGAAPRSVPLDTGDPSAALRGIGAEIARRRGRLTAILPEAEVWRGRVLGPDGAATARRAAAAAFGVAPDALALRLGPRARDGARAAAAVRSTTLEETRAFLASAGLRPSRITAPGGDPGFAAPPCFTGGLLAGRRPGPRAALAAVPALAAAVALMLGLFPRGAEAPPPSAASAPAVLVAAPPALAPPVERAVLLPPPPRPAAPPAPARGAPERGALTIAARNMLAPPAPAAVGRETGADGAPALVLPRSRPAAPAAARDDAPAATGPTAPLAPRARPGTRAATAAAPAAAPFREATPAPAAKAAPTDRALRADLPRARPRAAPAPAAAAAPALDALMATLGGAIAAAGPASAATGSTAAGELPRARPAQTAASLVLASLAPATATLSDVPAPGFRAAPPQPRHLAAPPAAGGPQPVDAPASARAQPAPAPAPVRTARIQPAVAPPAALRAPPATAPVRAQPARIQPQPQAQPQPQPQPARIQPQPQRAQPAPTRATATPVRQARAQPAAPTPQAVAGRGSVALIGIFGNAAGRHALIQLPNGATQRVRKGDQVQGVQVTAINADGVHLRAQGRDSVLKLPD